MNLQHFADIASTKNLVNYGKLMGIIRREVRGKDAVLGTAPTKQLAGSTWRISSHIWESKCLNLLAIDEEKKRN